jgi:hypothetical protein
MCADIKFRHGQETLLIFTYQKKKKILGSCSHLSEVNLWPSEWCSRALGTFNKTHGAASIVCPEPCSFMYIWWLLVMVV